MKRAQRFSTKRLLLGGGVALVGAFALVTQPVSAQNQALVIPYTAISAIMSPLWVAVEAHLFDRYGVPVTTVSVANGAVATAGMLGGSYSMIMNDGPSTVLAAAGGAPVIMVLTLVDRVNQAIMARPQITSAGQLRGQPIGVTTLGTLSGFAMRLFLQRNTLSLNDVNIVQLQTLPALSASLLSGKIMAAPFSHPLLINMRNNGMHALAELWKEDISFLATGLETTTGYLTGHRETVRRVVEGLIAGEAYIKAHPDQVIPIIEKYTKITDTAALRETWSVYAHELFLAKPYPSVAGARTVITLLSQTTPAVRSITPERVLDASLVRGLDRLGVIDQIQTQMK